MTAVTHGGDPQRLREIGGQLGSCAHGLDGVGDHGDVQMRVLVDQWAGTDMEHFAGKWPDVRQAISAAAEHCRDMAQALDRNAVEQEGASAGEASGAAPGSGSSFIAAPAAPPAPRPSGGTADRMGRPPGEGGGIPPEVAAQWASYTEDEKEAILVQMIEEQAAAYGIEPCPLVTFRDLEDWGGYFPPGIGNFGKGRIELNSAWLDDPEMLVTVAHEMRHAMQTKAIDDANPNAWERLWGDEPEYDNGVTPEEVEIWKENDENYHEGSEEGDSPEVAAAKDKAYAEQPLEVDAEEVGWAETSELTPEELDRLLEESQT